MVKGYGQGFALAWVGRRELSSEMISSVASFVGVHMRMKQGRGLTALEGERWNDRRFMYALSTQYSLRYYLAVPMRGVGDDAATATRQEIHVHVPSQGVNGHGRLYS